jgi:tRNA (cytidine/uridine-2'-O-)-methyltransferase
MPTFHVVLHQPEIPNNTGNIGRTCIATGAALHLVRPLGFSTSEKACRRAGLDYWPRLAPTEHEDWAAYLSATGTPRRWFFTTKATRPLWAVPFQPGDHLVFGKETAGLPADVLSAHKDALATLPMVHGERSLNLATAVCAALYEALRQCVSHGQLTLDDAGRLRLPAPEGR